MQSGAPWAALAAVAVAAVLLWSGLAPADAPPQAIQPFSGPLVPEGWPNVAPDEGEAEEPAAASAPPGVARIEAYSIQVHGEPAHGLVARPANDVVPLTLAVFAHPWGGEAADYEDDLLGLARRGVVAVAMDFRGPRDDFKVQAGVEDTLAATLRLQADYPTIGRTLLYGHSMGGEVAMLAAMAAPPGTYDYVFSGAGVSDLEALWHSFVMVRPAIERETGGTPAQVPEAYDARSPVDRIPDLLDRGVSRYFIVHGAGDTPVPVDHAERLYEGMEAAGLPVSYYVVTMDEDPPWCPVPQTCIDPDLPALADHAAGRYRLMQPFVDNRIERLPDPPAQAVRGTYDGDSGQYDPSDVG